MSKEFVDAIAKAVQAVESRDLDRAHAIRLTDLAQREQLFMDVVGAIVEGEHMNSATNELYGQWMEEDIRRWANWIRATFGSTWGDLADVIVTEGY